MRKVMALGLVVALCGYAFGEVTVKPIPTTKPAATVPAEPSKLSELIEKMPKELRYTSGEASTREQARKEWVAENICWDGDERKKQGRKSVKAIIEGVVVRVATDPNKAEFVYATLLIGPFSGLDSSQFSVVVELPAAKYKKETMGWNAGDTATASGELTMLMLASNKWGRMKGAEVVSHATKVAVTKPAKKNK